MKENLILILFGWFEELKVEDIFLLLNLTADGVDLCIEKLKNQLKILKRLNIIFGYIFMLNIYSIYIFSSSFY